MKRVHFADKYIINPTHQITVNLVGIGGTGSMVLSSLARIDCALRSLGHPGLYVTAFDPDVVTEANIGRQLFSPSDIGLNKAVVLVSRINTYFGYDWQAIPEEYDIVETPTNITITCVDTVKARMNIAQVLSVSGGEDDKHRLYWLDFGNMTNRGQIVLGTLDEIEQPESDQYKTISNLKTVTELFDLSQIRDEDSGPSCSLAEALHKQDLFINSSLSQLGCALLWKLLSTGMIDYHGTFLNLETMNVNPIKL